MEAPQLWKNDRPGRRDLTVSHKSWSRKVTDWLTLLRKQVIPFLPFEQEHIVEIIALKLRNLDVNYRGKYWHRLWVEVSAAAGSVVHVYSGLLTVRVFTALFPQRGLADYMSRLDSVHYEVRSAKVDGKVTSTKIFAKYGARDVETGPIQMLKSKLLRYLRPFNPGASVS